MACGIVPAISAAPRPPLHPPPTRRPPTGAGRDDVGPGAHAEDLAALAAGLLAIAVAVPLAKVRTRGLGVHVGGNGPRRRRELLPKPTQLQDLVAQRGRPLELEISRRLLHLRLEAADHRGQLRRLRALDLQRRALLGNSPQPLVNVADRLGDRLRDDPALLVVSELLGATPVGLVDGRL